MTTSELLVPTVDDLDSIVSDLVFTLDELPERDAPNPTGVVQTIRGRVTILGAQSCVVEVRLSLDGARLLAQAMFDLDPDVTSESDVRDAVGELANIVAGNTKSLADSDLALGLPLTEAVPPTATPSSLLSTIHHWRGHDLIVTINPTGEQP
ncbi:chemotaxis protein CheX [Solicola sp. PLA-1-18]|uniref:chemotaxis protein CheX n=1 Tax=Solicola sp. PLA-1-18 TaxID=3380532 RepID=UPI003B7E8DBE